MAADAPLICDGFSNFFQELYTTFFRDSPTKILQREQIFFIHHKLLGLLCSKRDQAYM